MEDKKPHISIPFDGKEPEGDIDGVIVSDFRGNEERYKFKKSTKLGSEEHRLAEEEAIADFEKIRDKNISAPFNDNKSRHNDSNWVERLDKEKTYKDLSTVILCPTRGMIPSRVVANWQFMRPMNQKVVGPIFLERMEVGEAYNQGIKMILEHPQFKDFKYLMTIEDDNYPQYPDGLMKLYENMDKYDCIGGMYWTKGEQGQPMCYGDPSVVPLNFIPRNPTPNTLTPCNGLGMGFNLWNLNMFRDERFEYGKWFKTEQSFVEGQGAKAYTQDLYFFEKAVQLGYKMACDARVPVIHWDEASQTAW